MMRSEISEEMKIEMITAYQGVKEKIDTIMNKICETCDTMRQFQVLF